MNEIITTNQKTYNALAEQYEEKVSFRKNYNESVVTRFVKNIKTGNRILDLGCAVGLDTQIFMNKGFSVLGIDISEGMSRFAQERNPQATIITGNFIEIPFTEKFDGIFAQAFIHLFPKEQAVLILQKIKALLQEGGVAHITTSLSTESKEGWFVKTDYTGEHQRFRKYWTVKELKETLTGLGFTIVDYYEPKDLSDKEWMVFTVKK